MKMRLLLGAVFFVWACGWSYAQSPIRISAYPYPDPTGYGRRLQPLASDIRPKRNSTYVVPESQIDVDGTKKQQKRNEDLGRNNSSSSKNEEEEEADHVDVSNSMTSVNRMGLATSVTRRKVPSIPIGPRRRSSALSPTVISTTLRSLHLPPAPPAPPEQSGDFGPPAILGIGSAGPPAPPVLPPSIPQPTLTGSNFKPPAIPQPISSPSPPPGAEESQVTEIRCMETGSTSSFMALLSLPIGYNAIPVFEDRPSVDPTINTACRMIPTQLTNDMFQLIVSDLQRCGVRKCRQSNGETWLCLTLRFPLVNGLKLPEDEVILIRCRPQDKMAQDTHVLTVATAKYAAKGAPINQISNPSIFEGGQQDFRCEIGLFRKLPGTQKFALRVTGQVELDLGEEVQLKSIVKSGDGWEYSLLTTVIIQKVGSSKARSILNAADLVFADGCRNPSYRVIAQNHPKREPGNPLINSFTFRVFMFQDMTIDDDLMITANVIGCVEAQDCQPKQCEDPDESDGLGYGKRKKRAVGHYSFTTIIPASELLSSSSPPYPPPITSPYASIPASFSSSPPPDHRAHKLNENTTTSWERNLNIKVKIPNSEIRQKPVEAQECRLYLFITLGVAAVFCVASIVFVIVTLFRSRSSSKRRHPSIPVTHIHSQSDSPGTLTSSSTASSSSTCSSSILSSEDSLSSAGGRSPLRDFVVPPTVRQRKREVNAELMNVFEGEHLFPYGTYCPGMLNYYGYMVVPRKSPADTTSEKRSLRAVKRDHKKHRIDRQELQQQHQQQQHHQQQQQEHSCRCSNSILSESTKDEHITSQSQNHKSVIHIPAAQPNTSFPAFSQCPKPKPRMKIANEEENIYSEIPLDNNPTMV